MLYFFLYSYSRWLRQVAYSASKGAISSLILPLTCNVSKYGIRCISIAPTLFESGIMETISDKVENCLNEALEFHNVQRPEELASLVKVCIRNTVKWSCPSNEREMRMPSKMLCYLEPMV